MIRTVACLMTACAVLFTPVAPLTAQTAPTLRNAPGPAELPPSSYRARQYVDSRGCVFIRAGVNGATRWVPRVNRDRSVVCGAAPSLPNATRQAATTPRPAPQPQATPPTTTVTAVAPTARPEPAARVQAAEPVLSRTPAAAQPRTIVTAPTPAPAATPRRTVRAAPTPAPQRTTPRPQTRVQAAAPRVQNGATIVRRGTAPTFNEASGQRLPRECAGAERLANGSLSANEACKAALRAQGFEVNFAPQAQPAVTPQARPVAAPTRRASAPRPAATRPARATRNAAVARTRNAPQRGQVVVRRQCASGICSGTGSFTSVRRN